MGQEFEIKLRLTDPAQLGRILDWARGAGRPLGAPHRLEMESCYYDTPDRQLRGRRWTLRLRKENGRSVATVKTPGKGGARGEWETESENLAEAIPALCAQGAPEALRGLPAERLSPVCAASFVRLAQELEVDGARVELALDRGELRGGGRSAPLLEAEVECKEGSREAAACFARCLQETFGLEREERSKFARAAALAEDQTWKN